MKSAAESSSHRNFRATVQDQNAPRFDKREPRLVGVIADRAALEVAAQLRALPDFFELRLDALADDLARIERALPRLRAPLIFTARHPAEGGAGNLAAKKREELLRRFLEHAAAIDVELRSAPQMKALVADARRRKVTVLCSVHHLHDTPSLEELREEFATAVTCRADIFKLATRTDTVAQVDRLLGFFHENAARFPIAAMGMGKFGAKSRRQLLRLGSALNYAAVGTPNAPGQLTLAKLRRTRSAYIKLNRALTDASPRYLA